jgi:glycosyltransferase involved in cell wall biosynthesis
VSSAGVSQTLDILLVSDVWPPHFIGGYELGAADVVRRLTQRGHRVTVLTSTYGLAAPESDGDVHRLLYERMSGDFLAPRALLRESLRSARRGVATQKFLRTARFDLVYVFNLLGLNARLLQDLADTGRPLVAYVSDSWAARWPWCDPLYTRWMEPRPYLSSRRKLSLALARRALRRLGALARRPEYNPIHHAQFVSRYIRDISAPRMPLQTQEVIPWGIDVGRFAYLERPSDELRRWVYVGQLEEHKGAHTAVAAVKLLREQGQDVELTLFGRDTTGYAQALKRRVAADGLEGRVRFAGGRAREDLWAEASAAGGLLVFPTMWEEPFSITVLEAFASGLPVLSTLTGGTGEIVRHGETATVFSAGSEQHLAAQWCTLVRHPERVREMARRARAIVAEHLDVERMVDRLEHHLVEVAEGRGSAAAEPYLPRPHAWEPDTLDARLPTRAVEPSADDGAWLAALWHDLAAAPEHTMAEPEPDSEAAVVFPIDVHAPGVHQALGWMLWELLRHHPRHRYLASDDRVQAWFRNFTRGRGRLHVPTLADVERLIVRRED